MYRHDNPLTPRSDTAMWAGGILAVAIVLGIILFGVTRTSSPPSAAVPPTTIGSSGSPVR